MVAMASNLQEIVALFHLRGSRAIPLGADDWLLIDILELTETAALAVTCNLYLQQVGNRAICRRSQIRHTFFMVPKEDRYDRTF